jgi:catechol 2,3-dioxygenase-like lactoylglutathione lyase family enzyme
MTTLAQAKPVVFVCTADRPKAIVFYRDVLGLKMTAEDEFAAVFDIAGVMMRLSTVPGFKPGEHPILGFNVSDAAETVKALRGKGVTFLIYEGFGQDELGIWTSPDGKAKVAWFKDPDGNMLSVTQAG